jgi:Flp pilus assembly pilin Flp
MISYLKTWLALKTDRRAVTALEYGLIAALIALGISGAVTALAGGLSGAFAKITALLP